MTVAAGAKKLKSSARILIWKTTTAGEIVVITCFDWGPKVLGNTAAAE